jgi:hypothetical protein
MAKRGRPKNDDTPMGPRVKTSISIPDGLLQRLKHEAIEQRLDVSSLICRLAEEYLTKPRKGTR